jgi:hypothetical protein
MSFLTPLLLACGLINTVRIPLILSWVAPNPIYGFRTSGTVSIWVWYPASVFADRALLIAASVSAASLLLTRKYSSPMPGFRCSCFSHH